jgi:holo-[acyl-carrier protein] synthase
MKFIGHGIDIVEIPVLRKLLGVDEDDLLSQSFTDLEQAEVPEGVHRVQYIAGRFAAKEAVLKALGTGFGDGVAFTDVHIVRSSSGAPTVQLSGAAATASESLGITTWLLSISHSENFAVASAIAAG